MVPPASPSPTVPLPASASECGVCLESLSVNLAALPCGHVFHRPCATLALAVSQRCPICRQAAESATRLFYTADTGAGELESVDGISSVVAKLGKNMARLNANMRRVSSHSFRLQAENARLRLENARVAAQLEVSVATHNEVARELGVWKRISTSTHAHLRSILHEKSRSEERILAEMKEIESKMDALSVCSSCEQAANASRLQLHSLSHLVESAAEKKQPAHRARKLACCTTENASRALRCFCARHSGAASASTSPSPSASN